MAFAQVYHCEKCGDTWRVTIVPHPCGNDDYVEIPECDACHSPVREKFIEQNGELVPVWHALTEEEIIDETTDYSDPGSY